MASLIPWLLLVISVSRGQVFPRRLGAQNPKHPEGFPAIAPRPAPAIRWDGILGQECVYDLPLLMRQVHPQSNGNSTLKVQDYLRY